MNQNLWAAHLPVASAPGHDRAELELRSSEDQAERWASLLQFTMAAAEPAPLLGASPVDWQRSDGGLTPEPGPGFKASAAAAPEPGAGASSERLTVRVSAGDLGELELVIDRSENGIRVLIGVPGARAERAVEPERAALERALVASGIRVESVSVVRLPNGGTVLAHTGLAKAARSANSSDDADADPTEDHIKSKSRRINFIG